MAVHAGNPAPYVHKVINKLVDRLHSAKNWLVRVAWLLAAAAAALILSAHFPCWHMDKPRAQSGLLLFPTLKSKLIANKRPGSFDGKRLRCQPSNSK